MNTGDPALKNPSPLLHWLLRKHPDTPKTRAKQWITAGRVSVDGVIIRKPHQIIADPGGSSHIRMLFTAMPPSSNHIPQSAIQNPKSINRGCDHAHRDQDLVLRAKVDLGRAPGDQVQAQDAQAEQQAARGQ